MWSSLGQKVRHPDHFNIQSTILQIFSTNEAVNSFYNINIYLCEFGLLLINSICTNNSPDTDSGPGLAHLLLSMIITPAQCS